MTRSQEYQQEYLLKPKRGESQEKRILAYLQSGRTLTVMQAIVKFDCFALSQRITRLKSRGYDIKTEMIETKTGKRIAKYSM